MLGYTVLDSTALHVILWYSMMHCRATQRNTLHYNILPHNAIQHKSKQGDILMQYLMWSDTIPQVYFALTQYHESYDYAMSHCESYHTIAYYHDGAKPDIAITLV